MLTRNDRVVSRKGAARTNEECQSELLHAWLQHEGVVLLSKFCY